MWGFPQDKNTFLTKILFFLHTMVVRQAGLEGVSICHRQSVSVTDSMCLSKTICVYHRGCVSFTVRLCLSQTICVYHRGYVSFTVTLCLSQTVCFCHQQSMTHGKLLSVTENPFFLLSEQVCVCHRQYIIINNGILKSNCTIFPRSEGYITQYTPSGVYGIIVNENNEVNISLMTVKMI